jgi:PAS domain S-box-containing protein
VIFDSKGKPKWVEGNIRDIRKQKKAELEHDKLFNVSFDLLCIAGLDGYFKELNPAWENATGYTLQELYSKPFRDFIHPEDFKKTEDEIGKLIKGKVAINFENRYIAKSGDLIDLSWTAIAVPEDSKLYCIARDVTEKKTAEKSIIEYQDRLKDLARELTIAEEKIRKQIAVDLHDHVGQMLSSARMQMTRIIDMEKDVDLVVRMKSISQTLLRAIQATRAAIFDLSPPQLNEIGLIAAVEDWMKEQIEEKHPVKIRFTNEKEPFNLDEDTRYLLFRSIKELVINVVKHAKATQIHVASYLRDNQFEIIVKDNGIGFQYNPDILKLKSNVYGLFSINERISNLGGNMYVDSKIPGGTTIKLTLPLTGKQQ